MTTKELRELDAWIAENVMGWHPVSGTKLEIKPDEYLVHSKNGFVLHGNGSEPFSPTTNSADFIEVLEKYLDQMKDGVYGHVIEIQKRGGAFNISCWHDLGIEVESISLKQAISLFAKKLFSKEAK